MSMGILIDICLPQIPPIRGLCHYRYGTLSLFFAKQFA